MLVSFTEISMYLQKECLQNVIHRVTNVSNMFVAIKCCSLEWPKGPGGNRRQILIPLSLLNKHCVSTN